MWVDLGSEGACTLMGSEVGRKVAIRVVVASLVLLVGLAGYASVHRAPGSLKLTVLFSGDDYGNVKPCG